MKKLSFLLVAVFLMIGVQAGFAQAKEFKNVEKKEFKQLMNQENVVILDVRTPGEYQAGHIEGAVNFPLNTIPQNAEKLDKNKKYLVYCRSGVRSRRASVLLSKRGFEVYNLLGGYLAWQRD